MLRLNKSFLIILFLLFLTSCGSAPLNSNKCKVFKKTSNDYIKCMHEIVASSDAALNLKEFKKHKTLKSFFKQVEVKISD